jgi:hypothetical protein
MGLRRGGVTQGCRCGRRRSGGGWLRLLFIMMRAYHAPPAISPDLTIRSACCCLPSIPFRIVNEILGQAADPTRRELHGTPASQGGRSRVLPGHRECREGPSRRRECGGLQHVFRDADASRAAHQVRGPGCTVYAEEGRARSDREPCREPSDPAGAD